MEIRNLSFRYTETPVLENISAVIAKGRITTIIGANGCGKSTLFNLMTKNIKPGSGGVYIENSNIKDIPLKEFAKVVAIVHQYNTAPPDTLVKEVVAYGRMPHTSFFRSRSREDERVVDWAMDITSLYALKNQPLALLSGGERQRVWIAMALAQKTEYLLLDEPTTHLDVKYQIQILDLVRMLNQSFKMTVVMILHDINQAIYYSDEIIGMADRRVIFRGSADQIINSRNLYEVYQVDLNVIEYYENRYVLPLPQSAIRGSRQPAKSVL